MMASKIASLAGRIRDGLQRLCEATELGPYTLEEKIGEGGMGSVYRARHTLLRRPAAIKLLSRERTGERNVQRFEREVQLTSSLSHPNTIAIYDYGHTPDGLFYYAMEYVDGLTLDELVEYEGAQPAGRVVRILDQICAALAEAHARGLVHRDVKPANVMLCVRGLEPDTVKLLDFGLVKQLASDELNVSSSQTLLGTPLYLAPETIGNPQAVDARADLYAVGAVGYFMLTGKPVFEGRSLVEVCAKHLTETPIPPSERAERSVPEALERLILACLAKDPAARPSSATELRDRLRALVVDDSWDTNDARTWWHECADEVMASAKIRRQRGSHASGSRTRVDAVTPWRPRP